MNETNLLEYDFLQKSIIESGLENTLFLYLNKQILSPQRIIDLCKLTFKDLGYDINRIMEYISKDSSLIKILNEFLLISDYNYGLLKDHDKFLQLCFQKKRRNIINFILKTRNYFDAILMLLLYVNKEIKKNVIDIELLACYLCKLTEYDINYIDELEYKIKPLTMSQLLLYLSQNSYLYCAI